MRTDDDFDGYLDDDSESDGGDDDNSGNVSDGHMSVDNGNDSNTDGHMSVDGGNSIESDDGESIQQKLEVAEEEVDVKGEVEVGHLVEGGGMVEGGIEVGGGHGQGRGQSRGYTCSGSSDNDGQGNTETDIIPTIPPFTGSPGCTHNMRDKSPIDFFELLIPDDLLQVVVDETNWFAQQYINTTELSCFSRVQLWEKKHTLLLR